MEPWRQDFMDANMKERLLKYYTEITKPENSNRIDILLDSISDQYGALIEQHVFSNNDAATRIAAYAEAITEYQRQKDAENMNKVLDTIGDYDLSLQKRKTLNGNEFIYEPDFPIESYMEELEKMGDYEQGQMYSVFLEDGKLVIY